MGLVETFVNEIQTNIERCTGHSLRWRAVDHLKKIDSLKPSYFYDPSVKRAKTRQNSYGALIYDNPKRELDFSSLNPRICLIPNLESLLKGGDLGGFSTLAHETSHFVYLLSYSFSKSKLPHPMSLEIFGEFDSWIFGSPYISGKYKIKYQEICFFSKYNNGGELKRISDEKFDDPLRSVSHYAYEMVGLILGDQKSFTEPVIKRYREMYWMDSEKLLDNLCSRTLSLVKVD